MKEIEIFVPGRLCLFGEHSDWAGGHRRQNSELERGYAIIAPTNQGNYARINKINKRFLVFKSAPFNTSLEIKLEEQELLRIAEQGSLFSYVAGVAHEIITNYRGFDSSGIEINNYRTDLPIKKGLSSSASISVLVARAFNEIFDLNFKTKRIMELAYLGEITTPSRCGRMDQACAYDHPVLMEFNGDKLKVNEIHLTKNMSFLIVDLKGQKDTKKILADLNKGFPFPTTDLERLKQKYLGEINKSIVLRAVQAIKNGQEELVGMLMSEAQKKFDEYLAPACPDQLTSPLLHKTLFYPRIQKYIYGGKGVGSQGDGCAQLICRSGKDREKTRRILESDLKLECYDLDLTK